MTRGHEHYSICLNMIVKDESHVIEKTLRNIVKHIPISTYLICDTGSTDNTIQVIKKTMEDLNIDGEVLEHEWKNFEHNRNLALKAAKGKAEYAFIFDADDFIHGSDGSVKLPKKLAATGYNFKFYSPGCAYVRPLLVRLNEPWEFEGVVHECLSHPHNPQMVTIEGDYTVESGRSGSRNKDPRKYEKDAILLETAFKNPATKKGLLPRYAFYCGQSWMDDGKLQKGIEWYKKCVFELPNWSEEKYYSCYRIGQCLTRLGKPEEAVFYFLLASDFSSERLEAVIEAAKIYYSKSKHTVGHSLLTSYIGKIQTSNDVPANSLFAPQNVYKYDALLTLAIGSYYASDFSTMKQCVLELYNRCSKEFSMPFAEALLQGSEFYFTKMKIDEPREARQLFADVKHVLLQYSKIRGVEATHIIREKFDKHLLNCLKHIYDKPRGTQELFFSSNRRPKIMATITTCRRLNCFVKTMQSIIDCFDDFDKISSWYVIDDNSSDADKSKMKELFPFINLIEKKEDEKGHRKSMNIIHDLLMGSDVDYWLHLEDDWLFLRRGNYLTPAIECLESRVGKNLNVKQILFNKGYGETVGDVITPIGSMFLPEDSSILLHVQNQRVPIPSSSYWAHYSFRPSLCSVAAIRSLGNFNSKNSFFEGDYANRFCEHGYRSAYFNDITCLHIGRLSGVRGQMSSEANAYELNNVNQFSYDKKADTQKPEEIKVKSNNIELITTEPLVFDESRIFDSRSFTEANAHFDQFSLKTEYKSMDEDEFIKIAGPNRSPFAGKPLPPKVKLLDVLPINTLYEEQEEFVFVEGWDIVGYDAEYVEGRNVDILKHHSRQTPHCLAFNTLGFTKHTVAGLTRSPYFGTADGVYIKKSALAEYDE